MVWSRVGRWRLWPRSQDAATACAVGGSTCSSGLCGPGLSAPCAATRASYVTRPGTGCHEGDAMDYHTAVHSTLLWYPLSRRQQQAALPCPRHPARPGPSRAHPWAARVAARDSAAPPAGPACAAAGGGPGVVAAGGSRGGGGDVVGVVGLAGVPDVGGRGAADAQGGSRGEGRGWEGS